MSEGRKGYLVRRVMALVCALGLLMTIPLVAEAAKPEQFKFEGGVAFASWVEEGEETTAFADAFLHVGEATEGGETYPDSFFDIFVGEFGPDGFTDLFGFADLTSDDYELDVAGGSFSALVEVEVLMMGQECTFGPTPFPECTPIDPFLASVAVAWDETSGRIYPNIFNGRFHAPFGFFSFRQKSLLRPTSATGSITADGMSIELGASVEAAVGKEATVDRFRFTLL